VLVLSRRGVDQERKAPDKGSRRMKQKAKRIGLSKVALCCVSATFPACSSSPSDVAAQQAMDGVLSTSVSPVAPSQPEVSAGSASSQAPAALPSMSGTPVAVASATATLSPTQVCQASCSETGSISLPQALCEDYQLARSGPLNYEFCVATELSCESRCAEGFAAASPACQERLPSAIECVVETGFYQNPAIAQTGCLFLKCVPLLEKMVTECSGQRARFADARKLWVAQSLTDYQFRSGQRLIRVRNGVAELLSGEPAAEPPSIEGVFEQIKAALDAASGTVVAEYDSKLGYPTRALFYGDSNFGSGCSLAAEFLASDLTAE
jgi:hypothetical protein